MRGRVIIDSRGAHVLCSSHSCTSLVARSWQQFGRDFNCKGSLNEAFTLLLETLRWSLSSVDGRPTWTCERCSA